MTHVHAGFAGFGLEDKALRPNNIPQVQAVLHVVKQVVAHFVPAHVNLNAARLVLHLQEGCAAHQVEHGDAACDRNGLAVQGVFVRQNLGGVVRYFVAFHGERVPARRAQGVQLFHADRVNSIGRQFRGFGDGGFGQDRRSLHRDGPQSGQPQVYPKK